MNHSDPVTSLLVCISRRDLSISCQASADVKREMSWVQIKLGQRLQALISHITTVTPVVPARISSRGSGKSNVFSISPGEPRDSGDFCMHDYWWPVHSVAGYAQISCCVSQRLDLYESGCTWLTWVLFLRQALYYYYFFFFE